MIGLFTMSDPTAPPPGFGQPDINRGPQILTITGTLTAIGFVFLVIRFYVRWGMSKDLAGDDLFCALSWVITVRMQWKTSALTRI